MKSVFFFFFAIIALPAFGQSKPEELPYIDVTGTAEKEVIPDEIYLSITLRERYEGKTKIPIEAQEEKLKDTLRRLNIGLDQLSVAGANAGYIRVSRKAKDVITRKDYELKLSDATTLGKLFEALDQIAITDAAVSRVHHSKMDELRREVRIQAMIAAKEKADYLLAAIGEQTGKPLVVQERDAFGPMPISNVQHRINETIAGVMDAAGGEDEIQFNKIKIQISIYVKFGIK